MTFPAKIGVWNGEDLKGDWQVTVKIDGVRAIWARYDGMGARWESRAAKPLYNLPDPSKLDLNDEGDTHFELYLGSLKDTVRACRTKNLKPDTPRIVPSDLYRLDVLDKRLDLGYVTNPKADWIRQKLGEVNSLGLEGLVLRNADTGVWLKVKPVDTVDLRVTGYFAGTGKHTGRLGGLITSKGRVGTGFTDEQRQVYWNQRHRMIGTTIEVEIMQYTPDGKMRHSRFIRERFDKVAEE